MLNCYGLKALHQYLTIPFLRMKQHSLLAQLRRSTEELQQGDLALASVLGGESDSSGSSYRQFAHLYEEKRRDRMGMSSHGAAREAILAASAAANTSQQQQQHASSSSGGSSSSRRTSRSSSSTDETTAKSSTGSG